MYNSVPGRKKIMNFLCPILNYTPSTASIHPNIVPTVKVAAAKTAPQTDAPCTLAPCTVPTS